MRLQREKTGKRDRSFKNINVEPTSFDDAFQGSDGYWFVPVKCDDYLPPVRMAPFLVAPFLTYEKKSVLLQDSNNFTRVADWEPLTHVSATSRTLAPGGITEGVGSNQRSKASLAFVMASSSASPADAQPGSSGKNADHLPVALSCSITKRSFIVPKLAEKVRNGKAIGMAANAPSARDKNSAECEVKMGVVQ